MNIARVFTANVSGFLVLSALRQFFVFPIVLNNSSLADEFAWSILLLDIMAGSIGAWFGDYYYKLRSNNRSVFLKTYFSFFFLIVIPPISVIAALLSSGTDYYFYGIFILGFVLCYLSSINMLVVKFRIEDGKSGVVLILALCRVAAWLLFLSLHHLAETSQTFSSILIVCFIFGELVGSYILRSYSILRLSDCLVGSKRELIQSFTFVVGSTLLVVLQRLELLTLQALGEDDFAQVFVTLAFINLVIMPINLFTGLPMVAMLSRVGEDSAALQYHVVRFAGGLCAAIFVLSVVSPYLLVLLYHALYPQLQMVLGYSEIRLLVIFGALFLVCARIILKVASEQLSTIIFSVAVLVTLGVLTLFNMSATELVVYAVTLKGLGLLCCMLWLLVRNDKWAG